MRPIAILFLLPFMAFLVPPTDAAEFESAFTSLDLEKDCMILTTEEDLEEPGAGAEWVCPGYNRVAVWVGEGDLRYFLGYGSRGRDTCAYRQTLAPFNTIHKVLEWRLAKEGGKSKPVATILRYFLDVQGKKREFLVVSKIGRGEACHMAHVDAAQPDHNKLAQQAADSFAPTFSCKADKPFGYGPQGRDPNGVMGTSACGN